ncbi:MAG: adenylosuccinate synthase, partial [Verrucomicrobia bacterium]|nr:adenylosuccinate synthase [Verrucomicrobiota bacterium]
VDGLDTLDVVRVCVAYRMGSQKFDHLPADTEVLGKCQPVYVEFPGWKTDTTKCRKWKDLPSKARTYLNAIAELTGARLSIVSVGPGREQTLFV